MTALVMKRGVSRKRTASLGASRSERRERQRYAALVARVRGLLQREIELLIDQRLIGMR